MSYPKIEVAVNSPLILVVCVSADSMEALLPALDEVKRELQTGEAMSVRGITPPHIGDAAYSFDLVARARL